MVSQRAPLLACLSAALLICAVVPAQAQIGQAILQCPALLSIDTCGDGVCTVLERLTCDLDCLNVPIKSWDTLTMCGKWNRFAEPETIDQVVDAVNVARDAGVTVRAVGTAHSSTSIACPSSDGWSISTRHLDTILGMEELPDSTMGVRIQAGVLLRDLVHYLADEGYTVGVTLPDYTGMTVGGLIATGTHGSSMTDPVLIASRMVIAKVVLADGSVREFSEFFDADHDYMKAVRVSWGLLGVVAELVLRVEPMYNVHGRVYFGTEADFLDDPNSYLAGCHHGFTMWLVGAGQTYSLCATKTDEPADSNVKNLLLEPDFAESQIRGAKAAAQGAVCFPGAQIECLTTANLITAFQRTPLLERDNPETGERESVEELVGPVYTIAASIDEPDNPFIRIPNHFWSVAIPEANTKDALNFLNDYFADRNLCVAPVGVFVRYVPVEDASFLASVAPDDDLFPEGSIAIHIDVLNWVPPTIDSEYFAYERQFAIPVDILIDRYGARPHIGKGSDLLHSRAAARHQRDSLLSRFADIRAELDPEKLFSHPLLEEYFWQD